jgi:hypothetical protein
MFSRMRNVRTSARVRRGASGSERRAAIRASREAGETTVSDS